MAGRIELPVMEQATIEKGNRQLYGANWGGFGENERWQQLRASLF